MKRKKFFNHLMFLKKTNETPPEKTVFPQKIFPKTPSQATTTNSEIKSKISNLSTPPIKIHNQNLHLLFNTYLKSPLKKILILRKTIKVINWTCSQPQIKLFLKVLIPLQTIWKDIHQARKLNSFHKIQIPTHPHQILVIRPKITKSTRKCWALKK